MFAAAIVIFFCVIAEAVLLVPVVLAIADEGNNSVQVFASGLVNILKLFTRFVPYFSITLWTVLMFPWKISMFGTNTESRCN